MPIMAPATAAASGKLLGRQYSTGRRSAVVELNSVHAYTAVACRYQPGRPMFEKESELTTSLRSNSIHEWVHPHMKRTIRIHRTKTHPLLVLYGGYRTSRACLIAPSLLVYADVQHYGGSLHIEISRVDVGLVGCCSV